MGFIAFREVETADFIVTSLGSVTFGFERYFFVSAFDIFVVGSDEGFTLLPLMAVNDDLIAVRAADTPVSLPCFFDDDRMGGCMMIGMGREQSVDVFC